VKGGDFVKVHLKVKQTKNIDKKSFIKDYFETSNDAVASKYGISKPTVIKLARQCGVRKGSGFKAVGFK